LYDNLASNNTALGASAALNTTTGGDNTAVGYQALFANSTGTYNVAVGEGALNGLLQGVHNLALGDYAGLTSNLASTISTLAITTEVTTTTPPTRAIPSASDMWVSGQSATYISGIYGEPLNDDSLMPVYADDTGKLGTNRSSRRYKEIFMTWEMRATACFNCAR